MTKSGGQPPRTLRLAFEISVLAFPSSHSSLPVYVWRLRKTDCKISGDGTGCNYETCLVFWPQNSTTRRSNLSPPLSLVCEEAYPMIFLQQYRRRWMDVAAAAVVVVVGGDGQRKKKRMPKDRTRFRRARPAAGSPSWCLSSKLGNGRKLRKSPSKLYTTGCTDCDIVERPDCSMRRDCPDKKNKY